jgi:hypothetical protein
MEEDGKTPRISEGCKPRFPWEKINIHNPKISDLISRHIGLLDPGSQLGIEI